MVTNLEEWVDQSDLCLHTVERVGLPLRSGVDGSLWLTADCEEPSASSQLEQCRGISGLSHQRVAVDSRTMFFSARLIRSVYKRAGRVSLRHDAFSHFMHDSSCRKVLRVRGPRLATDIEFYISQYGWTITLFALFPTSVRGSY